MTLPKQLAIAAREGDLSKMQQLINSDNELATTWQPIMEACFYGQADALIIPLCCCRPRCRSGCPQTIWCIFCQIW